MGDVAKSEFGHLQHAGTKALTSPVSSLHTTLPPDVAHAMGTATTAVTDYLPGALRRARAGVTGVAPKVTPAAAPSAARVIAEEIAGPGMTFLGQNKQSLLGLAHKTIGAHLGMV